MVELMEAKTVRAIASALFFTAIVALMFTGAFEDDQAYNYSLSTTGGHGLSRRACDEIYVVGEGETLHSISAKCDDPLYLKTIHISMTRMMLSLVLLSRSPLILLLL
ncbi:hypothetical protein HanRHA438_Chr14g0681101 [Helianthus annuus]|nr:hypothetical protein HanRHA438_Chr14g0681101 [Helianthus annuus]